jgi:hypothetical protein
MLTIMEPQPTIWERKLKIIKSEGVGVSNGQD